MNPNEKTATLHDIQTGKTIAEISLIGEPIRADELISTSGQLQSFAILSHHLLLEAAWFSQKAVMLRIGNLQQQVKIITYPSEGENQGHLDFIPGTKEFHSQVKEPSQKKARFRRGLAIIQTILSS